MASTKNITQCVSEHSDSRELSMSIVDDTPKISVKSCISANDPESTFIDFLSIFDYWGHIRMRTLCQLRNVCSSAVSSHETLDSDGFSDVGCHLWPLKMDKWTNTVSGTEIKPSCAGTGQKLISVDQKPPTIMVTTL